MPVLGVVAGLLMMACNSSSAPTPTPPAATSTSMTSTTVAAVTTVATPSTTTTMASGDGGACVPPPEGVPDELSAVALSVNPNPVSPGGQAVLSVSTEGLPADAGHGIAAAWECWNGTEWIQTHTLLRGLGPCSDPQAPPTCGEPEVREPGIAVWAIGLGAHIAYPILIPDVPPGIYRISDWIGLPDDDGPPQHLWAFVLVWVR